VLIQLSLTDTPKVIFLPFPVPRVVSNIVRIVCNSATRCHWRCS